MAITEMSTGHQYTVASFSECLDNENRIDPSRAHDAYGPDVGRVLQTGYAGQIRTGVGTPVTKKCHDFGFEVSHVSTYLDVNVEQICRMSFIAVSLEPSDP